MIIKKLNTMFHKHSRVLWGSITVVIAVSFLGFLTPGTFFGVDLFGSPLKAQVGVAFGEPVTAKELRDQSQRLQVFNETFYGASMRELDIRQAFAPYCMVLAAKRMGLVASDKDVAELLRQAPALQKDGRFSHEQYQIVLTEWSRRGLGERDINDAFRDMVLINKLTSSLIPGVMVTPGEVESFYRQINTRYQVRSLTFDTAEFKAGVDAKNAEKVNAWFMENRANYTIPTKVAALLATFRYRDFLPQAQAAATPEALQNFFAANGAQFADKDGKAPEFAKVADQVKAKFIDSASRDLALRRAYEFASAAYEAVGETGDKAKAFRAFAEREKAPLLEAGLTPVNAPAVAGVVSRQLLEQLEAAMDAVPVTNAVPTDDAAYVGFVTEKVAARPAEFNDMPQEILNDYVTAGARGLARQAADEAATKLAEIKDPALRAKAFKEFKGGKVKEFEFSLMQPPMADYEAAAAVLNLPAGEFSKVYESAASAGLAELVKRLPADMKEYAAKKTQMEIMYRGTKEQLAQRAFEESIFSQCQLTIER